MDNATPGRRKKSEMLKAMHSKNTDMAIPEDYQKNQKNKKIILRTQRGQYGEAIRKILIHL